MVSGEQGKPEALEVNPAKDQADFGAAKAPEMPIICTPHYRAIATACRPICVDNLPHKNRLGRKLFKIISLQAKAHVTLGKRQKRAGHQNGEFGNTFPTHPFA